MLRSRVITAAIGLPAIILSIFLGPVPFAIFLSVVATGCIIELLRLSSHSARPDPITVVTLVWTVILATRFLTGAAEAPGIAITLFLVLTLLLLLQGGLRQSGLLRWALAIAGVLYVGWLLGYWGGLYVRPGGHSLVLFGLLVTFAYDTSAYFVGHGFGRHRLAPALSAGKTWEGVGGGVAGALLIAWLSALLLPQIVGELPFGPLAALGTGGLLAIAAQVGDLVESALKRSADVKDAGTFLRGHGGMLDRFDSVLLTGTVLYYVSLWLTA